MKTQLKSIHEEEYSDKSRILGVLFNFSNEDKLFNDSYVYIYRDSIYIFFETIVDMIDYLLYGDKKTKRAYMPEDEFDNYYDAEFIEGRFNDKLKWT